MNLTLTTEKIVLTTFWVFALMCMIHISNILNTLNPGFLEDLDAVAKNLFGETILFFALLIEIPIFMIFLSRILNRKANRIANFIAASISILWVIVPIIVMSNGNTPIFYIFFAAIETMAMLFIIWYCYGWENE